MKYLYLILLLVSNVVAEEQCVESRDKTTVYCFDCETNNQEYWCSKQVPQPHTCCNGGWQIRDSDKGDTFPSILFDCNVSYSFCVERTAKEMEMYNGCAATKGLTVVTSLDVIERRSFDDLFECQAHDAACGYTYLAWQSQLSWCLYQ